MDEDFWTTEIANTPEEDASYGGMGKVIALIVLVACILGAIAALIAR